MKIGCMVDKSVTENPREIMDLIEANLDKVLEDMNWRSSSATPKLNKNDN